MVPGGVEGVMRAMPPSSQSRASLPTRVTLPGMFRFSIKTKLSAVIAILVLGFALLNVAFYPRQMERRFRAQAEWSARQVAEAASVAGLER